MTNSPEQTTPDHLPPRARPLSPHLGYYRTLTQITSLTSILHRMTGAALVGGSLIVVAWLLAIAHGEQAYTQFTAYLRHPLGQIVLFGFTWAFLYHIINGCRHLTWDTGHGLKKDTARLSGKLIIVASVVATIAIWSVIFYHNTRHTLTPDECNHKSTIHPEDDCFDQVFGHNKSQSTPLPSE